MDVAVFKKKPILGILRGIDIDLIEPLIETVISAGLETLEITMNTYDAAAIIKKAKQAGGKYLTLGAGTVLTRQELNSALKNGASFIVLPVLVKEVVEYCIKNKIPVFPGAFTPQEIYQAHKSGATMVKVFPGKFFGPEYLKEIKGPFAEIELLACGGVTPGNLKNYFAAGASAVTFGASIFRRDLLLAKDFKAIGRAVKEFIDTWENSGERKNLPI
ncbi:MAG: bifunctional 4-hydroxy-2-oxoglutarate aldolase/2-dehydro-3-deoxy-phosphogluconate aldolase [Candidatus Omnitrophica bacterium]|nr:bifunctional 4-hydroxy-2-oxoglutarate aldolase/2-dehydro-3-deoxy-phosphogluconate aldolase [Candidatus Omnitrophota bacterium]